MVKPGRWWAKLLLRLCCSGERMCYTLLDFKLFEIVMDYNNENKKQLKSMPTLNHYESS